MEGSQPSGSDLPSQWTISDCSSGNGTYVNFVRVKKSVLRPGDRIGFGRGAGLGDGTVINEGLLDYIFEWVTISPHGEPIGKPHQKSKVESFQEKSEGVKYKQCMSYVFPPPGFRMTKEHSLPPATDLEMDFMWGGGGVPVISHTGSHGYRGVDCRNNLHFLPNGELAWNTAATAVMMDCHNRTQRFFCEHDDDIMCIAVHPTQAVVATGQVASQRNKLPPIIVWDAATAKSLCVLQGAHTRKVTCLCFSAKGTNLFSVGGDDQHTVAIQDWKKGQVLFSIPGGGLEVRHGRMCCC